MRLGTGRLPPGDGVDRYHYPQGAITVRASGLQELIEAVFEYRLRNNIETADVERDIHEYYCRKWPGFCVPEPHDRNPALPRLSGEPMLNRVSRWAALAIRQMPRGGYTFVTSAVAEQRAGICAVCPRNVGWRGNCGGCSASTLQLVQQLKSLKKTKQDGNLRGCLVGGWENSSACWLPASATPVSAEQRNAMPDACWRKGEA